MIQKYLMVYSLVFTLLSLGCVREVVVDRAAPNPAFDQTGTGDSGGGNTYKGRPLDSYILDPHSLRVTQEILAQKINSLRTLNPEFATVLSHILDHRYWYFLPGPLSALPKEKIGSAVAIDQAALQDLQSIWIDSDLFDKMSPADQATLMMHELVMGAQFVKYQPLFRQCKILSAHPSACSSLNRDRALGKPSDLGTKDYHAIRAVTALLMHVDSVQMNSFELNQILDDSGFGYKFYRFLGVDLGSSDSLSWFDLRDYLVNQMHRNELASLSYGYLTKDIQSEAPSTHQGTAPLRRVWRATTSCSFGIGFSFSGNDPVGTLKFNITPIKEAPSSSQAITIDENYKEMGVCIDCGSFMPQKRTHSLVLRSHEINSSGSSIETKYAISFYTNKNRLDGLMITKLVPGSDGQYQVDPDDVPMRCGRTPEFIF